VGGRLVQAQFPDSTDPAARQRRTAQLVGVLPKTFGVSAETGWPVAAPARPR
jgi:hypothetical protein